MNTIQYIDPFIKSFVSLHDSFEQVMFHGKGMKGGMEEAKRDHISEYVNLLVSLRTLSSSVSFFLSFPFFFFFWRLTKSVSVVVKK